MHFTPCLYEKQRLILFLFVELLFLSLLPALPGNGRSERQAILVPRPLVALLAFPLHAKSLQGVVDLMHDFDGWGMGSNSEMPATFARFTRPRRCSLIGHSLLGGLDGVLLGGERL